MSLFSTIQLANNALSASQIGLQVVGQNIANANTPGYIREEVILSPAPTQRDGNLLLGLGVQVKAVVQKIDLFLEDRLRGSTSERVSAETQENAYLELEGLIGELSDTDLSTSLNNFFNSVTEVLNQPESVSVRNLAVLQAETLSSDINRLAGRVRDLFTDLNKRIISVADDINSLTAEIATLNIRIAEVEGGTIGGSDAVGLRDQRLVALSRLAELIDVRVEEQTSGGVAIFSGGEFLVFEGRRRAVDVEETSERGLSVAEIQLAETQSPLTLRGGEAGGLTVARDQVLGTFLDNLDAFAGTLAFEFNKAFVSGQGLSGYEQLVSEFAVDDADQELDAAGLPFTPVNGAFDLLVHNTRTGLTQTTQIRVDLNGLDEDTTLNDIVTAIDAIDGVSASVNSQNRLQISSDAADTEFAFGGDTSGLLAALGVNTLFSGSSALDLGVSQALRDDPGKFAASRGGIGEDTENAVLLASFIDQPLETANGSSLAVLYDRLVSEVTQGSTVAGGLADGFRIFESTLLGQKLAISGVSLDEEAVQMLTFQRAYQASARLIATLSDLLDILVNL
jgi:flagellar hook-associated protein 1 FlgK